MRQISLILTVLGLSMGGASVQAQTAMVASGVKTRITTHSSIDNACNARHLTARLTKAPANGTVTFRTERDIIPARNGAGREQPAACVGKSVMGIAVYYQSKQGFVGEDSFSYLRLNSDLATDRNNGEISRTVNVR